MADIELVIKINEKYLKDIKECVNNGVIDYGPWASIANGTPLPQGHGRLIDADKFQRDNYLEKRYGYDFYREFQSRLKSQLTVVEADKEGE